MQILLLHDLLLHDLLLFVICVICFFFLFVSSFRLSVSFASFLYFNSICLL